MHAVDAGDAPRPLCEGRLGEDEARGGYSGISSAATYLANRSPKGTSR